MLTKKLLPLATPLLKARYATIAHERWPSSSHPLRPPTPYQILGLDPSAPYSKARFTELVKIYHPDRKAHPLSNACAAHLDPATRLDRYRLIVAAHALLSDPQKRHLYDSQGLGWAGEQQQQQQQQGPLARYAGQRDPEGAASAGRNATWEDWEQWRWERAHARGDAAATTPKQEPVYLSNGGFGVLVVLLAVAAVAAQVMHAETLTERQRILREENHWKAMKQLEQTKAAKKGMTREERIEEFLRQREPAVMTNKSLAKMMLEHDICDSGDEAGKSRDLDMRRKTK
jgi:curved DNA-binding protein CbpA